MATGATPALRGLILLVIGALAIFTAVTLTRINQAFAPRVGAFTEMS
jgi:hypothetical protein